MKTIILILVLLSIASNPIQAQNGCTDVLAINYNPNATINDGSCLFLDASVSPITTVTLNPTINETSGLVEWNNFLYTHNDNTDTKLYKLNKITGEIVQNFSLSSIQNIDWEEISQDNTSLYLGDFGNNSSGNRANLKIYKIAKNSLTTVPAIETINFTYSNQTDFSSQGANNTDFDCEAFVVTANEILLFTKQWVSNQTSIYSLPKTAGTHVASLLTTLNISGLITGATLKEDKHLIALSGYSNTVQPFIYLIYDYNGTNFTAANKRKITLSLPFHQTEGISTLDGLEYYLTNESLIQLPFVNNPQKLHKLSLAPYVNNYLSTTNFNSELQSTIYPNPTDGTVFIEHLNLEAKNYQLIDLYGKIVNSGPLSESKINMEALEKGIYFLKIAETKQVYKIVKK